MTEDMHGHEGPIVKDTFELRGETRKTWLCEACGSSVPRHRKELLEDSDCSHYQSVKDGIEDAL